MASLLLPSLFVGLVCGYDDFSNPPAAAKAMDYTSNVVWQTGSTQQVQWNTSLANYTMRLWQQDLARAAAYPGRIIFSRAALDPNSNEFSWTVSSYTFNLSYSNVYFLGVNFDNPDPNAESFTSHYFNMTDKYVPPTSSATSSSSSLAAKTSSSSTSGATSHTLQSIPKSKTNTVGLGVGIGIGLSAIAIALALIAFWILKKQKAQQSQQSEQPFHHHSLPPPPPPPPKHELPISNNTSSYGTAYPLSTKSVVANSTPAEMPTSRY